MMNNWGQRPAAVGDPNTSPALQLATIAEVSAKIAGARTCEAILRVLFSEARWLLTFARCALVLPTESTARVYRRGMPVARAMAIIESNAGPQWAPALVERFLRLMANHTAATAAPAQPPLPLRPHGEEALAGGE